MTSRLGTRKPLTCFYSVCLPCAKCSVLRFISLQETTQRPFENDDSLEQKKQQTTEKSSATTPTGQSTGKKVTVISTNLYLKSRHSTVLKDFKRCLYITVNLETAATPNIA